MKAYKIFDILNKWAKPSLIDSWDNTGFQIGNDEKDIKKILIALDVDRPIVDKAIKGGYDLIITHHPFIFNPMKDINNKTYNGRLAMDIIKNDILIYNAHSNLDLAKGGVNDVLADKLKIKNRKDLNIVFSDEEYDYGYGRIGNIKRTNIKDLILSVKNILKTKNLIVYGDIDREVEKIAVCGGSGSGFIRDAYEKGAEVYITGDIKYHDAQLGHELGMVIIDGSHFDTEKLVLPYIKKYLKENIDKKMEIDIVMESSLPKYIY